MPLKHMCISGGRRLRIGVLLKLLLIWSDGQPSHCNSLYGDAVVPTQHLQSFSLRTHPWNKGSFVSLNRPRGSTQTCTSNSRGPLKADQAWEGD